MTTRQKWAGAACCFVAALSTPPAHAKETRPTRQQIADRVAIAYAVVLYRRDQILDYVVCPGRPTARPTTAFCELHYRGSNGDDTPTTTRLAVAWQARLLRPGNRINWRTLNGRTRIYRSQAKPHHTQYVIRVVPAPEPAP